MFGFLILWMTVVGLGVSVAHCHGASDPVQSHCLGWGCTNNAEPLPYGGNSSETHSHLILLGFEMPGEYVPGVSLPAGVLQLESATSSALIEADGADLVVLDQLDLPATSLLVIYEPLPQTSFELPASKNQLSHFASRLLSGVLVS